MSPFAACCTYSAVVPITYIACGWSESVHSYSWFSAGLISSYIGGGMLMFGPYNLPKRAKEEVASNYPTTQARMVNITGAEMKTQGSGVFHHVTVIYSFACVFPGA